jgi:Cu/Ag efflux protein CusF
MKHFVTTLACALAVLVLTASLASAQTTPNAPGAPSTSDSGLKQAPPTRSTSPAAKVIDGPVKDVDPAAKTVDVGWFLGFFTTTLEVTDDTRIAVDGMNGSLDRIREGDRVKASYEAQDGRNVAKAIDVIRPERAATPSSEPAQATSPQAESPQTSARPPLGGSPKTP